MKKTKALCVEGRGLEFSSFQKRITVTNVWCIAKAIESLRTILRDLHSCCCSLDTGVALVSVKDLRTCAADFQVVNYTASWDHLAVLFAFPNLAICNALSTPPITGTTFCVLCAITVWSLKMQTGKV